MLTFCRHVNGRTWHQGGHPKNKKADQEEHLVVDYFDISRVLGDFHRTATLHLYRRDLELNNLFFPAVAR